MHFMAFKVICVVYKSAEEQKGQICCCLRACGNIMLLLWSNSNTSSVYISSVYSTGREGRPLHDSLATGCLWALHLAKERSFRKQNEICLFFAAERVLHRCTNHVLLPMRPSPQSEEKRMARALLTEQQQKASSTSVCCALLLHSLEALILEVFAYMYHHNIC